MASHAVMIQELPPRTRRIHPQDFDQDNIKGTTSAYAENTCQVVGVMAGGGNYLRVRGEYTFTYLPSGPP